MEEEKPCCPVFDPKPWDGVEHAWNDKLFLMGTIPQFLHMPLPGKLDTEIGRLWKRAQDLGIAPAEGDFLLLMHDPSPWKAELFLSVTGRAGGERFGTLSGTFVSKVFDGPYNAVPSYIKELDAYLAGSGKAAKDYYFYYTTCPKCAKKYGHNYIVAFAAL